MDPFWSLGGFGNLGQASKAKAKKQLRAPDAEAGSIIGQAGDW